MLLDNVLAERRQPHDAGICHARRAGRRVALRRRAGAGQRRAARSHRRDSARRDAGRPRSRRSTGSGTIWNDDQPQLFSQVLAGASDPAGHRLPDRQHRDAAEVGSDAPLSAVAVSRGRRSRSCCRAARCCSRSRSASRLRPAASTADRSTRHGADRVCRADARHAAAAAALRALLRHRRRRSGCPRSLRRCSGSALNYAAYESEIYRGALLAVPVGQLEAARTLGFSEFQTLRLVRGPQAFRLALAPMTNDFVALLKDSSLVSVLTVVELTKQTQIFATNLGSWVIPGAICAAMYLAMSLPLAALARALERRWRMRRRNERRHASMPSHVRDLTLSAADGARVAAQPRCAARRSDRAARAVRLRQDDDSARHRRTRSVRARNDRGRRRAPRGRRASRPRDVAPAAAQRRARLPVSLPLRAHVGAAERLPRTVHVYGVGRSTTRSRPARELLKQLGVESRADALAARAVGRRSAERGHRARARGESAGPADGRADGVARSVAARRARRAAAAADGVWADAARHHARRTVRAKTSRRGS